jgi:hypothetical protein
MTSFADVTAHFENVDLTSFRGKVRYNFSGVPDAWPYLVGLLVTFADRPPRDRAAEHASAGQHRRPYFLD